MISAGGFSTLLHRAITGERIGDRPADDREGEAGVGRTRHRDRGIAGIARAARRSADATHQLGARGKPLGIRLQKADAEVDIGYGLGIARRRWHAKVDRQHGDTAIGEMLADRDIVQPVAHRPRAAVHFEHRGERAAALRTVKAGQQRRRAGGTEIFEVFRVDGHHGRRSCGRCRPAYHIGGLTPSFSAVTREAERVPSGFFVAAVMIAAPGFSRLASPGAKVTMGVFGATMISDSPPL